MLSMEHVDFAYEVRQPILRDVSLTIAPGEFVAFAGRNGSGKTTVTRLLMGLEQPRKGRILYDGKDVTADSAGERSRYIGYVFQQPERQMFRPTVSEEVAFGPRLQGLSEQEVQARVEEALEATRLTAQRDTYPLQLSRGEKQRVAIASALAMRTRFLILDEPTSGQDGGDRDTLLALLTRLKASGIGVLFVTHDMEIIAGHCDRVIVLAEASIVFDGTPERLFTQEETPEEWGLARPASVRIGLQLSGAPYCPRMSDVVAYVTAGGVR